MKSYADIIKLALIALFVVGLWLSGKWVYDTYQDKKTLQSAVDQQVRTGESTSTITSATGAALNGRQIIEFKFTQDRATYTQAYEDLRNEDASVRVYTDTPVPAQLRELAKNRRLSRDGLGGDQTGSGRSYNETPTKW